MKPNYKLAWSFSESTDTMMGAQQIRFEQSLKRGYYRVLVSCCNNNSVPVDPIAKARIELVPDTRPQGVSRSTAIPGIYRVGINDGGEFITSALTQLNYAPMGNDTVVSVRVEFYEEC